MAVPSVRSQVQSSLLSQLREKLEVEKNSELPRELWRQVDAYMAFYDQFWRMSKTLDAMYPDDKGYNDMSKERRQVNGSMLAILNHLNSLPGKDGCFIDALHQEG